MLRGGLPLEQDVVRPRRKEAIDPNDAKEAHRRLVASNSGQLPTLSGLLKYSGALSIVWLRPGKSRLL